MAYARLATVLFQPSGRGAVARDISAKAFELRDRVRRRSALRFSRSYASNNQSDKEVETYELWVRTYPRDLHTAKNNLGVSYTQRGEFEKARFQLKRLPNSIRVQFYRDGTFALSFVGYSIEGTKGETCQSMTLGGPDNLSPNFLFQIAFLENDVTAMKKSIRGVRQDSAAFRQSRQRCRIFRGKRNGETSSSEHLGSRLSTGRAAWTRRSCHDRSALWKPAGSRVLTSTSRRKTAYKLLYFGAVGKRTAGKSQASQTSRSGPKLIGLQTVGRN